MLHKFGLKLLLATFFIGLSITGASAASIIVNITGDPNGVGNCATGGSCSLRQAIASAAADDGIFFDIPAANCPNGVCTINLTSGLIIGKSLSIFGTGTRSLFINGNGASGGQNSSVINVVNNTNLINNTVVTISGLTVTGGNSSQATSPKAGGITADIATTVVLNYVTVTNNQGNAAGGIYCNRMQVISPPSTFGCTLTLLNSLVSDNTGITAGGIENHGTMQIVNSTISGNLANSTGVNSGAGGVSNTAFMSNEFQGVLNIINSTIANNVSNNGVGGVSGNFGSPNSPRVRNTIIANNRRVNQSSDISSNFVSRGNNLIGNTLGGGGADGNGGFGNPNSNDYLNQPANIKPLANNGGQSDTHALLAGSPAINAGNNCVTTAACLEDNPPTNLAFDQRAQPFARTFGVAVDIGAFEAQQRLRGTLFDFDGDEKADVAVTRNNGGNLVWYLLNSVTGFRATQFGLAADKAVPADYDGDGKTDIAVVRANANNSLTWYFLLSRFGFASQTFGLAGDTPVPADYDGDGLADVAVTRAANGSLTWYLIGSASGFKGLQFGSAGDVPAVGDYDADGKADTAVFRPSNNNWYLLRSSNGQFQQASFGATGDVPVPADYDGDGATNLAVFRPSNGIWYYSLNLNTPAQNFRSIQFGVSNDVPVPADYDGDGKTDVAVVRSNGTNLLWYLNRSQAGFNGIQFGVSNDKAVENAYIP